MKLLLALMLLYCFGSSSCIEIPKSCPELKLGSIPSNHLFHTKKKPLIIAHRGQPMKYQENTLEGIHSAAAIGADGYELDIYKTKDDKLVVFHDDNTLRMTGVSKTIWESTYEELRELNLKTEIKYGDTTYKFDKPRKIPLLEDVLKKMKKTNLVHYLEMKPSKLRPGDDKLTEETGKMVAKLVSRMSLEHRAIIVSFDYRKVHWVKKTNPKLTVGTLYSTSFSKLSKPLVLPLLIKSFPEYRQCFLDAPSSAIEFYKFTLFSGLIFKLSGSSSFDSNLDLYSDSRVAENMVEMMKKNYNSNVSTGFYTMYSMSNLEAQNLINEKKLMKLLGQGGGDRLITDNAPRLKRFLSKNGIEKFASGCQGSR